jgi:hypothetical protein
MNGIPSLYQMTPTGVPFRTGARGESTSEQRYFVPGFSTAPGIPLTPEQQANQMMAAQRRNYGDSGGGDSGIGSPGSPGSTSSGTVGSSGTLGGIAQGVNAAVTGVQNALGPMSMAVPGLGLAGLVSNMGVEQAMNVNEQADAALAQANEQANQSKVSMGLFGPQVTTAVDIAPVTVAPQQVTSIAPDVVTPGLPVTDEDVNVDPTVALTQMNQQQAEEDETSPAAVAADVAATVAATADAVDAEAGANNAAAAAANAAAGGGGGGGGDAPGAPGAPGDAPSIGGSMDAAGVNDSGSEGVGSEGASPSNKQGGLIKYYNQGGVASLANRVQERGRGQDTMLVHMTPKEVGGLQALAMAHGGSLTINPQTGLPEAGFLSSILPMVAGAALAATGVGAPMAAMLVGGGYGLATGSLSKGLMAGLGAFGGAGLGTALSAAGAATAPALTGTAPGLAQAGAVVPQAAMSAAPGSFQAALPGLGVSTASSAAAPAAASTFAPAAAPVTFGNMASGIPALGTEAGRTAAMSSLGGGMGAVKTVGMAAAPLLGGMGEEPSNLPIQDQFIRPFKYKAKPSAEEDENFRYRTGERGESTAEQRYFGSEFTPVGVFKAGTEPAYGTYAMGGDIEEKLKVGGMPSFDDEYGQDEYAGGGLTAFKAGGLQDGGFVVPADVVAHLGNGSTDAGLRLLAKTLRAKPIKGNGDGMSDSIPTTIGGKQPARVADGEAYISPEVTKKVGSERLYKMMERIRKAKTGKKRQAPEINTMDYVPA